MSTPKKSFLLYCDLLPTAEKLTDDQAGKLFKHILKYANGLNPTPSDFITELVFEPIKQAIIRDQQRYLEIIEKRKQAGAIGGKQKVANASTSNQSLANLADNVNDNDNDYLNNTLNNWKEEKFEEFWVMYQKKRDVKEKVKTSFTKLSKDTIDKILIHVPKYVKSTPDAQYRKNPSTYLNQKYWTVEIEEEKPKDPKKLDRIEYDVFELDKYYNKDGTQIPIDQIKHD